MLTEVSWSTNKNLTKKPNGVFIMGSRNRIMANQTTAMWIVAFAILIGVAGGIYWMYGGAGTSQSGMFAQTVKTGGSGTVTSNCNGQNPVAQLLTYYTDTNTNNKYTQVSTNAYICMPGVPNCPVQDTTNATAIETTTEGDLSCGQTYREIAGDGGVHYYYAKSEDFKADVGVIPPVNSGKGLELLPSGSATLYTGNVGTLPTSSGVVENWTSAGKGAGDTDSNVYIRVQSPSKPDVFGDLGYAVCFRFNSGNFSKVYPSSYKSAVAIGHVQPVEGKTAIQCYEMGKLASGETKEITVNMKAISGVTPTNGTTVDVILVDKTNEMYNGYLVPLENDKAGVNANGYDDVDNPNSDVGVADVVGSSAITVVQ